MLTDMLRVGGFEVISWIENNFNENPDAAGNKFDFEEWMKSESANRSFEFDSHGAATCDLFIYYGPGGKDASAECGICYGQRLAGKTIPMLALWSKSEDFGLMRKMFDTWFNNVPDLIDEVINYRNKHTF